MLLCHLYPQTLSREFTSTTSDLDTYIQDSDGLIYHCLEYDVIKGVTYYEDESLTIRTGLQLELLKKNETPIYIAFLQSSTNREVAAWRYLYEDPNLMYPFLLQLSKLVAANDFKGVVLPLIPSKHMAGAWQHLLPNFKQILQCDLILQLHRHYHRYASWSEMIWIWLDRVVDYYIYPTFNQETTFTPGQCYGTGHLEYLLELLPHLDPLKIIVGLDSTVQQLNTVTLKNVGSIFKKRFEDGRCESDRVLYDSKEEVFILHRGQSYYVYDTPGSIQKKRIGFSMYGIIHFAFQDPMMDVPLGHPQNLFRALKPRKSVL